MKLQILTGAILVIAQALAEASPSTSANYSMAIETINNGSAASTSSAYSASGGVGGLSTGDPASVPASGPYLNYSGFMPQTPSVIGLVINSSAANVNEGMTLQLGAWEMTDDGSYTAIAPGSVQWNVIQGPIETISNSGVATAGSVYQDTSATVSGAVDGFTAYLDLTVLNVNTDDFGSYAGDGLPDDWQVQYFGYNNPLASPNADASGTGTTNLFKYLAGLNPLDRAARFSVETHPVAGHPGQMKVVFGPVIAGRTYTVLTRTSFRSGEWTPVTCATQSDQGTKRTVVDVNAGKGVRFYTVQISKP